MENKKNFELSDEALDEVAGGAAPDAKYTAALCRLTDGHCCPSCGHDQFRAYKMGNCWRIVCNGCKVQDTKCWPKTEELDVISYSFSI